MNKLKVEDIAAMIKANDFLKKEEEEKKFPRAILWALAIIGAIAAVAGIAYAVYLYFTPIWKTSKMISMMTLMMISLMKKILKK